MHETNANQFIASLRDGQKKLTEAPVALRRIGAVFSEFGLALNEFSGGKVGVACVTRDGHAPIPGDFAVGVPMSIVLVSHVDPAAPSPIVADLEISHFGFPVVFTFKGSRHSAFQYDAVSGLLASMANSDVFASALHSLMPVNSPVIRHHA